MLKVFICSPYRGDPQENLELAIGYCRMADDYSKLPIAPHVYFTRVFPKEDWRSRFIGKHWGLDLMQYCKEIWIFCDELTEGMIEEIEEAKKLGLNMKFYNANMEEVTSANYLLHSEIGPAYRRLIAESFGDRFYFEGDCRSCRNCKRDKGTETGEEPSGSGRAESDITAECTEEVGKHSGFFRRIFRHR